MNHFYNRFLLGLAVLLSASQVMAQGDIFIDNFDDGLLPIEWQEFNSNGRVSVIQNQLVMDYHQNYPNPIVKRSFAGVGGKLYLSFTLESERNWINAWVNLISSNQDTIAQLVIDDGGANGWHISNLLQPDGSPASYTTLFSGFAKNQQYLVSLEIDLNQDSIGLALDGEGRPSLPLLQSANDLAQIEIVQSYMFNNAGDTSFQNLYFDNFILSSVDKSILWLKLMAARYLLAQANVGSQIGQYPQSAYDALLDSSNMAELVFQDPAALQANIDSKVNKLVQAMADFLASLIPATADLDLLPSQAFEMSEGLAGYNVRVADSPWNYDHPDFRKAVQMLEPGFLRYYSGTAGDGFDMNLGLYDYQRASQFRKASLVGKYYQFNEIKGANRISSLNEALGEVGGRLVVTWDGFTDDPVRAKRFAKFCQDNQIVIDSWQMCNEPNFFGGRFFTSPPPGEHYVQQMRPIVDSIISIFPDASIALSYGWDGTGTNSFAAQVDRWNGTRYWNAFSKHSYKPHANDPDFESARRRAFRDIEVATNSASIQKIEDLSWPGAPIYLTEFGVWNAQLVGTMIESLYSAEFTARYSAHPNVWFIGKQQFIGHAQPIININNQIQTAYNNGTALAVDSIPTGVKLSQEGDILTLVGKAINRSTHSVPVQITGGEMVDKIGGQIAAIYAQAYQGEDGNDYLLVINKSALPHSINLTQEGAPLTDSLFMEYAWVEDALQNDYDTLLQKTVSNPVLVPPYSVSRLSWDNGRSLLPRTPRLYHVSVVDSGQILLKWWERSLAEGYQIHYGTDPANLNQQVTILGQTQTSHLFSGLNSNQTYYFVVKASNPNGSSAFSNVLHAQVAPPASPLAVEIVPWDTYVQFYWESVPYATGYRVHYGTSPGNYTMSFDAGNIGGAKLYQLSNGTTYYFAVEAYNGMGKSSLSMELKAIPQANIPIAPYKLFATSLGESDIRLDWQDTTQVGPTFLVYRSTEPWSGYQLISDTLFSLTFTDTTFDQLPKGDYYYHVRSLNQVAQSYYASNIAWVKRESSTGLNWPQQKLHKHNPYDMGSNPDILHYEIILQDVKGKSVLRSSNQPLQKASMRQKIPHGVYVWQIKGQYKNGQEFYDSGKLIID